ncbi:MAG: GlxA family transcriptional regulator [Thiolinea sp.]
MKTGILIADQFIMLNLDLVIDTLRIANRVVGSNRFAWQIYTLDNGPVVSCNSFIVNPDADWSDSEALDCVLVITGFEPEQSLRRPVMCWLKMQHKMGASVGCIDTGAFALATAGVLSETQPVAIHWEFEKQFRQQYPNLQVTSGGISCNQQLFSASGGLSVADMMLKLLNQYLDTTQLDEVRHILYSHGSTPVSLSSGKNFISDPISRIERAEMHMHTTLANPLSLKALASMVNMHPRTFARHFQERYGMTPMRYYRQLRLSHARDLLLKTRWPVNKIAELCGFSELTHFSASFSQIYGMPPQQLRSQR